MDAYPLQFTAHPYPLVVLLGFDEKSHSEKEFGTSGPSVSSNGDNVTNPRKDELLQDFLSHQGSKDDWSGRHMRVQNPILGYKFKVTGRQLSLPLRKAAAPDAAEVEESSVAEKGKDESARSSLHSPYSPLTPSSSLYPDGIFDPAWITKHQDHVPCMLVACYDFGSNSGLNSLNDNKLKTDIGELRISLSRSEYKTRLAVILLGSDSLSQAPDTEERLANIRRGTGLDAKTGLFFLSSSLSRTEITTFVTTFLLAVQPSCLEYYRELTKHARRKKSRGNVPPTIPPSDSSRPLSSYGWAIRYDVKQGIFAEFRQEMEAACRHYTSALEALMGSEGVFETTASWAPRWNEGRILADMMAFRIIRCLLWSLMGTTATQSWINYRDRMRELVDRKGKGSNSYGWEAWESRWAKIMAQLMQRADLQPLSVTDSLELTTSRTASKTGNIIYMLPEKAMQPADIVSPWHCLHHEGYWFRLSARGARRRRKYAIDIPEEDRAQVVQSPTLSNQHNKNYDTYLVPEPYEECPLASTNGFDHTADIVEKLSLASAAFKERRQERFRLRLQLDIGRELLRKGLSQDALQVLKPIWLNCPWRAENWWLPLYDLLRTLRECAASAKDTGLLAATTFELYSPHLRFNKDVKLDLMKSCQGLSNDSSAGKHSVSLSADAIISFLETSFVFQYGKSHAGETLLAQLSMRSTADQATAPVRFSRITAAFVNRQLSIELVHKAIEHSGASSQVSIINLTDSIISTSSNDEVRMVLETDLTLNPSKRSVFVIGLDIREPGDLVLESIVFHIDAGTFQLDYHVKPQNFKSPSLWFTSEADRADTKRITRSLAWKVEVQPKPPKLEIGIKDVARTIYTDEVVKLEFEFQNAEDEEVTATVDVRLLNKDQASPEITWTGGSDDSTSNIHEKDGSDQTRTHSLPQLKPGESCVRTASFIAPSQPSEVVLEAKLHYFLPSDPTLPLSKIYTCVLKIDSVFEANYDFAPRVHPAPWPSFFSADAPVPGLLQRWRLIANLASFAAETLEVKAVKLELASMPKGLEHSIESEDVAKYDIASRTMHPHSFTIDTTRKSPREHRQMTVYAYIRITWARTTGSSAEVVSSIPVSPMILPPLEPRIVATAAHATLATSSTDSDPLPSGTSEQAIPYTLLTLTLENPSQHPLTFDITAPSADSLAFSGPKQQGVNLLPYSRVDVPYRMLPLNRGGTWVTFAVKATDRYFAREVSILAGEGLHSAEDGSLRWFVE